MVTEIEVDNDEKRTSICIHVSRIPSKTISDDWTGYGYVLLADRTTGRAIGTVLRLSVVCL